MALCNNFSLSGRITGLETVTEGGHTVHRAVIAVPIQRKRIRELEKLGQTVEYGDCDHLTVVDYGHTDIDWDVVEPGMHATFEGVIANRDPESEKLELILDDALFPQLLEE